jgi:branched-chain amino acid transport system permease protein
LGQPGVERKIAVSMEAKSFLKPNGYVPLLALIGLAVFPLFLANPFHLHIYAMVVFSAALGVAWNLIGGYGGQLSIGHTAFFGIGAYTSTLLYVHWGTSPWVGMWAGGVLSMIIAAIVGYPSFRLRGPFFALSTIAFAEVLHLTALNWRSLSEGAAGLIIQFRPGFSRMMFAHKLSYVYLALGLLFMAFGVVLKIDRSKFGYYLRALREDEDGAKALGIHTARMKLWALMISAFLTALGGTFYAQYFLLIDPYTVFSLDLSIQMALVSIIGGIGTVAGPIIGSILMTPLAEFLRALFGGTYQGLHLIIYGAILIVVVIFLPQGIMEGMRKKYKAFVSFLPDFGPGKETGPAAKPHFSEPLALSRGASGGPATSLILEARKVTKNFGGLAAISNVSFNVSQGEILGLIGPNGAGKTTLFNLLSGFYRPTQGKIFYKGREVEGASPHLLCRLGIGRTFQIVKPFPNMSLIDNVTAGAFCRFGDRRRAQAKAEEVLDFVGLWEKRDSLAKSITIAEKKHLEVAKALATQPELILLDEVMAGLNPREVEEAMVLIRKINEAGVSVMVIEHVMAAIMSLCHQVMVLHHGEKIAEGSPENIAKDPAVIEAYLGEEYLIA